MENIAGSTRRTHQGSLQSLPNTLQDTGDPVGLGADKTHRPKDKSRYKCGEKRIFHDEVAFLSDDRPF